MEVARPSPVLAIVAGQKLTEFPTDLFIPPHALEILLDSFSGPLDLLLYLIRQQHIDIMNIPMALITQQYLQYIEWLEAHQMELAPDYLVMAAMLIEIKSKLLLPVKLVESDHVEEDPRMELVRRLQIYEQFKIAALHLDELPRLERDVFQIRLYPEKNIIEKNHPFVSLQSVVMAMEGLLKQAHLSTRVQITREVISVRERMTRILNLLSQEKLLEFKQLLCLQEGRLGVVVTFLALLELARQSLVNMTQTMDFGPIYLQGTLGQDKVL